MDNNTSEQCGTTLSRSRLGWLVALVCLVSPTNAFAGYSGLYIFGDSLSDSGNNAVVLVPNVTPVPISGNSFIPTYPYASGRYTNGQTWAQILASALGLNASPSLLGGTDYAFGGAQTGPATPNALPNGLLIPLPPSLETTGRLVDACQLQLGIAVTKGFSSGCITLLDVDPFVAISRLPLVEWLRRGEEGRHQFRG